MPLEFSVRQSGVAALVAALLLCACGRSVRRVGDDETASMGGAGDDGGGGAPPAGGASGGMAGSGTSGSGVGGSGGGGTGGGGTGGSGGDAECAQLSGAYEAAFRDARRCDPSAAASECTQRIGYGFQCGEDVFVNPSQTQALTAIQSASQAYADRGCGSKAVVCGAAPVALGANCSTDGECVTVYDNGARGCKVNGVVYAHGTGGIPALDGCNQCGCDDGTLVCTEIGCGSPCRAPLVPGTQCALCGPTDACQLVEYACFPACTSSADCSSDEACLASVCVKGICG